MHDYERDELLLMAETQARMAETLKSAVAVLRMMEQTSAAIERSLQVAARAQSLRYVLRREPPITLAEPE